MGPVQFAVQSSLHCRLCMRIRVQTLFGAPIDQRTDLN